MRAVTTTALTPRNDIDYQKPFLVWALRPDNGPRDTPSITFFWTLFEWALILAALASRPLGGMADAGDLKSLAERLAGSSPAGATKPTSLSISIPMSAIVATLLGWALSRTGPVGARPAGGVVRLAAGRHGSQSGMSARLEMTSAAEPARVEKMANASSLARPGRPLP